MKIDERGFTRELGDVTEHVAWRDLVAVVIVTTDEGPFAEDVFFLLCDAAGGGCAVPHSDAVDHKLLDVLQRLDGFDNEAVIRAMMSCDNTSFLCWQRPGVTLPASLAAMPFT